MVTVPYLGVTVVLGGWIDVECDGHACLGRDRGLCSHLPHLICQTLNGGSCLLLKLHILDGHLLH